METITLHSHVGIDGILKLEVPVQAKDADLDVVLIVQPKSSQDQGNQESWPPNFFDRTFGMFRATPLVREPQGTYEVREDLK